MCYRLVVSVPCQHGEYTDGILERCTLAGTSTGCSGLRTWRIEGWVPCPRCSQDKMAELTKQARKSERDIDAARNEYLYAQMQPHDLLRGRSSFPLPKTVALMPSRIRLGREHLQQLQIGIESERENFRRSTQVAKDLLRKARIAFRMKHAREFPLLR